MPEADGIYQSYFDLRWHFDPAAATEAGVTAQNHRLGEYDPDSMRAHLAAFRSLSLAIEGLELDDIQEEIDRTALLNSIRSTLFRFDHEQPHVRNPAFWLDHLFRALYALLAHQDSTREDLTGQALARLRATPAFLRSATETLRDPAPIFRDTAESMIDGGELLLGQVARFCRDSGEGMANEEVDQAAADAEAALTRFGLALKTELAASDDIQAFAIGEEQFNRRLHFEHALQSSAPELWRYGMHLVEEVEASLEQIARELEPGTRWRTLADRFRQQAPASGDLITGYRAAMERARGFVERHSLAFIPEAPLDVVATPEFLRPLIPFAAYSPPGALSSNRTGRFYVTPQSGGQQGITRSAYELPSMALHEGYPGHHLHMVTSQSLPSMVRRLLWSPASVEGWAVYCEDMMGELGYYEREERLFQKVHLLWRAVRILLDVGLHTRNMSPGAALVYLLEKVPLDPAEALAEVRRYCGGATYPMCYAVGRRDILALRSSYFQRERDGASLRAFHDELLSYGGLPVSLARWGMGLSEE